MKTFRELTVWQRAHELVLAIYHATTNFPSHEQYGLVSQMRRAAVSVAANIVEGHKRHSRKEFLHFLDVADGSLEELKYHVLLSKDLRYLTPESTEQLYQHAETVGRMLSRLRQHIKQEVTHVASRNRISVTV